MVEGRLQTRSWQDNSGVQKYRTEIVAVTMQLGPRSAGNVAPRQPQQTAASQDVKTEEIPIIEVDNEEIDVKDIPF